MNTQDIVTPSSQVDSTLPMWIRSPDVVTEGTQYNSYSQENHRNFVSFLTRSVESQERLGYSQNLLQNLLTYKDFNTYRNRIVLYSLLEVNGFPEGDTVEGVGAAGPRIDAIRSDDTLILSKEETEQLTIQNGYGFPEKNGVVLIDDEVILYRYREGNVLYDLRRGSSGTSILPTFRHDGEYRHKTEPAKHYAGAVVHNLSVLFLASILDQIHKTYAHNIDSERVVPEVNRDTLLKYIKDFFKSKGSKLGIKALFKFLFNENDVDVFYPGDRMIKPSESTWAQGLLIRTVPIPKVFCDPEENYVLPDRTIGSTVEMKSYSTVTINKEGQEYAPTKDDVFAKSYSDYTVSYQYGEETQYEIYLSRDELEGEFIANPTTKLTRQLYLSGFGDPNDERRDTTTITVESTLGFPNRGVIFIDEEAIFYSDKTPNQFLHCHRGYIGVTARHKQGASVYGPYYVETRVTDKEGVEHVSRSWPLGLVESISIEDPGLLYQLDSKITPDGPGLIDYREQSLAKMTPGGVTHTFLENYDDELVTQKDTSDNELRYVGDRTHGPDGIFFDDKYVFVSSSGFPSYKIGYFNVTQNIPVERKVGPRMVSDQIIAAIPRRLTIKDNIRTHEPLRYNIESKGTDIIGIFVDGVRAYSNQSPKKVIQGRIVKYIVHKKGFGYKNPTVITTPISTGEVTVSSVNGEVLSVKPTSDHDFIDTPIARITSGEGAEIKLYFDAYGRITSTFVVNRGRYYNDIPSLKIVDATGVGKGGLLSCTVKNGYINTVQIVNPGIDYNKLQTNVVVIPVGSGAEIEAVVESYDIDRYAEVKNNLDWQFDDGNGFLFEPPVGTDKKYYGYVCDPKKLREELGDDGSKHSPIIGWAFDGNPIYGPYGYKNNKDDDEGVEQQKSAYRLLQSRLTVIPDGGSLPGLNPPKLSQYPMGSFTQDYRYDPNWFKVDGLVPDLIDGYLANEQEQFLRTDKDENLEIFYEVNPGIGSIYPNSLLDENNGKICNTPDFPEELYPDGVYCYFVTLKDDGTPAYPYILGKTFHNRPISQALNIISHESLNPLPKLIYKPHEVDGTTITFDFEKVERLRNPYLESTKDQVRLEIGEVSEGTIHSVIKEIPVSATISVGDRVFFDNTNTGGAGAQAVVSLIEGQEVLNGVGSEITTNIKSHSQKLGLSRLDNNGNPLYYTIVDDSELVMSNPTDDGTSSVVVEYYDGDVNVIWTDCTTERLVQLNDVGHDVKNRPFIVMDVRIVEERKSTTGLWFEDTTHIERDDVVKIKNGSLYDSFIPHEEVLVKSVDGLKVNVVRGHRNRAIAIEDNTEVVHTSKFLYEVTTHTPHGLKVGDFVNIQGSKYGIDGSHQIIWTKEDQYAIYTDVLCGVDTDITYSTGAYNVQGQPAHIEVTSPGFGYHDLPKCLGIYKRFIDRGEFRVNTNGTQISSVDVIDGGNNYFNPTAVFVDFENRGRGAEALVKMNGGVVESIEVINPGTGYIDPVIYLVEMDGKFIATTKDIGKIKSVKVLNPGRNISADRSLKPEVSIETRFVVDSTAVGTGIVLYGGDRYDEFENVASGGLAVPENPELTVDDLIDQGVTISPFPTGSFLYQGTYDKYNAKGEVVDYDRQRQIITLKDIEGVFNTEEPVITDLGTIARLIVAEQSDCRVVVNGSSTPEGRFIDDTSMVSKSYAVIQDSYRFQWFSYVIASPIQQVDYGEFVREIIHPAGFIQFADLRLHDSIEFVERNRFRQEIIEKAEAVTRMMSEMDEPVVITTENLERGGMVVVGEDDLVRQTEDPCSPFVLLAGDGTPILSSTETGDKFTLTHNIACEDGLPLT